MIKAFAPAFRTGSLLILRRVPMQDGIGARGSDESNGQGHPARKN